MPFRHEFDGVSLVQYADADLMSVSHFVTVGFSAMMNTTTLLGELPVCGLFVDQSLWTEELDLVLAPDRQSIEQVVLTALPVTLQDIKFCSAAVQRRLIRRSRATVLDPYESIPTICIELDGSTRPSKMLPAANFALATG